MMAGRPLYDYISIDERYKDWIARASEIMHDYSKCSIYEKKTGA